MRRPSRAEIRPEGFAEPWLDARRKASDAHPIDPALREDAGTTGAELLGIVNRTVGWSDAAGERRWPPAPPPLVGSAPLHTIAPAS
ncbi:hypothetical protein OG594_04695 [Streptomyces sp. NBC_01214]|uniref:hypothetical protein n=1 Tax=Streptomyces sp. NBC_01214 TaxID=2903777 RepID=UPI00225A7693|nr:hypothetical protein [Streptomyces sp. NBC_01214]MCX4800961.1 hypothetical protein [Streptomyces sp. NBC_01214]